MQSQIQRWGDSHGIEISKYLLRAVDFKENEKIEISARGGQIIITKARSSLKEMFEGFTGQYIPVEIDCEPAGDEIW